MAKKKKTKLNRNAVLILLGVGAATCAAAGAGVMYMRRETAPEMKARGRAALDRKEYKEAEAYFGHAAAKDPTDVENLNWHYQTARHLVSFDETFYNGRMQDSLGRALNNAPRDPTSLRLFLSYQRELLEHARVMPKLEAERTGERARTLLASDPTDSLGLSLDAAATYFALAAEQRTVSAEEVQGIIDRLAKAQEGDPLNPDLLYYLDFIRLARGIQIVGAAGSLEKADDAELRPVLDSIRTAVDAQTARAAEVKPEERANLHRRAARTLRELARFKLAAEDRQALYAESFKQDELAIEHADPKARFFDGYVLHDVGDALRPTGNYPLAEKAYRKLVDTAPGEWFGRVSLGELLRETGRPAEALGVLDVKLDPSVDLVALRGVYHDDYGLAAALLRTRVRVALALQAGRPQRPTATIDEGAGAFATATPATQPAASRDDLLRRAEDDLNGLAQQPGMGTTNALWLQARGELLAARGRHQEAIETFKSAIDKIDAGGGMAYRNLLRELRFARAVSNNELRQTAQAREDIEAALALDPNRENPAARLLLAQTFLAEKRYEDARAQLEIVRKLDPDNTALARLAVEAAAGDPVGQRKAYDALPEGDARQLAVKLASAMSSKYHDDAVRVGTTLLRQRPEDRDAFAAVVTALLAQNKKDDAARLVEAELARVGGADKPLEALLGQIRANTPEERSAAAGLIADSIDEPYRRLLTQAGIARANGDEAQYVKLLEEADALTANNTGTAGEQLLDVYAARGEWDRAEATLARIATLRGASDDAYAQTLRGRLLLARANVEKDPAAKADAVARALDVARALTTSNPGYAQAWITLGRAQLLGGDPDSAGNSFGQALQRQPTNTEALRGAVDSALARGDGDAARRAIDAALGQDPANRAFNELSLEWELGFGDPLKTVEPRRKLIEQNPNNPFQRAALSRALDAAATRANSAGDADGFKRLLAQALEAHAEGAAKFPNVLEFTQRRSTAALALGRPDDAVAYARAFAEANPDAGPAAQLHANVLQSAKRTNEAEVVARAFLDRHPEDADVRVLVSGFGFQQRRDVREALAILEGGPGGAEGAEANPTLAGAKLNLLGQVEDIPALEQLLTARVARSRGADGRGDPNQLWALAQFESQRGRPDAAVAALDEALAQRPSEVRMLTLRASNLVAVRPPQIARAIADLTLARDAQPGNAEVRGSLAQLYRSTGDNDAALRELEAGLLAAPGDKRLLLALVSAYQLQNPPRWGRVDALFAEASKNARLAADPDVLVAQAKGQLERNNTPGALETLKRAQEIAPAQQAVVQPYAEALIRAGRPADVIGLFAKLPAELRGASWAKLGEGVALARLNRRREAEAALRDAMLVAAGESALRDATGAAQRELTPAGALKLVEGRPDGAVVEAMLRATVGANENKAQALASFDRALQYLAAQQPAADDVAGQRRKADLEGTVYNLKGTLLLAGDAASVDAAAAAEACGEAVKRRPDDITALNNYAFALALQQKPAEGLEYSGRAVEVLRRQGRPDPYVFDTHGWLLVQADRAQEGVEVLETSWRQQPLPDAAYHLAEGYLKLNRPDKARQFAQDGLALLNTSGQNESVDAVTLRTQLQGALDRAKQAEATSTGG